MVPTLKAEFKKLLTIRSTYILTIVIIILTGLFTYTGTSKVPIFESEKNSATVQKSDNNQPPPSKTDRIRYSDDLPKNKILSNLQGNVQPASLFIALVVILLMAHEFRYNTITYTLTSSNNRSKVLTAKILTGTSYAIAAALLVILTTIVMTYIAVHIKGLNLPEQDYNWAYYLSRSIGYAVGFSLFGLAIITLLRNLTAGIVALFFLPTIENIATSILGNHNIDSARFLPFTALSRIGNIADPGIAAPKSGDQTVLVVATITRAITITAIYFVAIWIISWYLFLRRDAN